MANLSIKTDKALLDRLAEAVKRKLSEEEIRKQRISFIFSGMPEESGMSKLDIEKALKEAS